MNEMYCSVFTIFGSESIGLYMYIYYRPSAYICHSKSNYIQINVKLFRFITKILILFIFPSYQYTGVGLGLVTLTAVLAECRFFPVSVSITNINTRMQPHMPTSL